MSDNIGLVIAKNIMMKFLFIYLFITTPFISFGSETGEPNKPTVTYFDESNSPKVTDWEVKYFPIWKKEKGEPQLYIQTWIALPPMLDLETLDKQTVILDNTAENKSPFEKNTDIDKVLRFETMDNLHVISLKKVNSLSSDRNNIVKIKVSFPDSISFIRRTKSCRKTGHNIEYYNSKTKPFIMFLDCSLSENGVLRIKVSPESEIESHRLLINGHAENTGRQQLGFKFRSMKRDANSPIAISEVLVIRQDNKQRDIAKITFQKKRSGYSLDPSTPEDDAQEENGDESTQGKPSFSEKRFLKKRNPYYSAGTGLLASRTGAEFYFSLNYVPKKGPGYYKWIVTTPFQYFSYNKKKDIYLDTQFVFLHSYRSLSYGAGIEFLHLLKPSELENRTSSLAGPNIRLQLDSSSQKWRAGASYAYLTKIRGPFTWTGHRLLTDLGYTFLRRNNNSWELFLMHSAIDLKHSSEVYKDYKFLGGVLYQW